MPNKYPPLNRIQGHIGNISALRKRIIDEMQLNGREVKRSLHVPVLYCSHCLSLIARSLSLARIVLTVSRCSSTVTPLSFSELAKPKASRNGSVAR